MHISRVKISTYLVPPAPFEAFGALTCQKNVEEKQDDDVIVKQKYKNNHQKH